jgi:hypothetical protein
MLADANKTDLRWAIFISLSEAVALRGPPSLFRPCPEARGAPTSGPFQTASHLQKTAFEEQSYTVTEMK